MAFEYFIDQVRDIYSTKEFVPLHVPHFKGNEKKYLNETIDSTFVSSVGKFVDEVEQFGANYTQTAKAIAVVNGTAAIQIALHLVGVKPNEEVITQALTFVATANAIAYNGAEPVFVDVDRDTMGMSPIALSAFLSEHAEKRGNNVFNKTSGKRIAAVLPMHTFGMMCRIQEIKAICNEWGIHLVEDAAEAMGSKSQGQSAGGFGTLGAFSFNGNKIITAGGGGLIVTNDLQLGQLAKHLTTTAKKPHPYEYHHNAVGYNFRMPNLNAALLLAQFEKLENYRESKEGVFKQYEERFNFGNSQLELVSIPPTTSQWNHWLISVQLENLEVRNRFLKETNEKGIMTRPIWQLMYKLPMYERCQRDDQKNAEFLEDRVVNIPSSARI